MQGIATEAIPCKMTCKALYMEEERAEGSCFLMVLCTEDQSSSQSSSTRVALALHGRSRQPFSQCTLFARIIISFSCKCQHSPHLFPSRLFSELEFDPYLNKAKTDVALLFLWMFCGLFFRLSDQKFGAFTVNFSGCYFSFWMLGVRTCLDSQLRGSRLWRNVQSCFN